MGWLQRLIESRRKPVLRAGERYCPACGGTRRTFWNIPAYSLRCPHCHGTGKVGQ